MQMDKSTHDLHMWIMINAAQAYKDKPKLGLMSASISFSYVTQHAKTDLMKHGLHVVEATAGR